jgi:hypothetical protein
MRQHDVAMESCVAGLGEMAATMKGAEVDFGRESRAPQTEFRRV